MLCWAMYKFKFRMERRRLNRQADYVGLIAGANYIAVCGTVVMGLATEVSEVINAPGWKY